MIAHRLIIASAFVAAICPAGRGYSGCVSLIQGPLIVKVNSCQILDIRNNLTNNSEYRTKLSRLDQAEKRRLVSFYRGAYLKGTVVRSSAKITGEFRSSANLGGKPVSIFVPPGRRPNCARFQDRIVQSYVEEACCDGQINPPCLLKSHLMFKRPIKVFALPQGQVRGKREIGLKMSSLVKQGNWFLKRKQYASAISRYQAAKKKGQLGVRGHYFLGFALQKIDRCEQAIAALQYVRRRSLAGNTWQNEQFAIQNGMILLARCYARQLRADEAIEICNSFLHNPRKYRSQIVATLQHKDFGWIKNNPLFQDYRKRAQKKVGIVRSR